MRERHYLQFSTTPHLVATRIGCVTCDQKVPGSNPVWVAAVWTYTKDVVVCKAVYGCVHLKEEFIEKSRGLSLSSWFL